MSRSWYRLDTAALIFPANRRRNWANAFRVSANMRDEVDPNLLQQAVVDLMPRFPTFYVRLRKGVFWCRLERINREPKVQMDYAYPLTHMSNRELRDCCLRVLYYKNRIAVELFHSITDGTGGSIFLRSLVLHYCELRYKLRIDTMETDIPLVGQEPSMGEIEDSFLRNSASFALSRREETAYRLHGKTMESGFRYLTTGCIETQSLIKAAHAHNCTVTVFLSAVMLMEIMEIQAIEKRFKRQKPVKITIPVNLRKLYGSETLRNFVLTLNIGVDPRLGEYSFDDICRSITNQLSAEVTPQRMAGRIAANVMPQRNILIRLFPLPIKLKVMDMVYGLSGERKGCINISNLGKMDFPLEAENYVERMEFIIGVQRSYPNNCSIVSYKGNTYVNMIRNIRESELERRFFSKLVEMGIPVGIESNSGR